MDSLLAFSQCPDEWTDGLLSERQRDQFRVQSFNSAQFCDPVHNSLTLGTIYRLVNTYMRQWPRTVRILDRERNQDLLDA
jgi:hypothetical protein